MTSEERITALETRVEYLGILVSALMGFQSAQDRYHLGVAIREASDLHDANSPYQLRLTDDQIQKIQEMLKLMPWGNS